MGKWQAHENLEDWSQNGGEAFGLSDSGQDLGIESPVPGQVCAESL